MTLVAPAADVERVTCAEVTAWLAVMAYLLLWAETVSEEVVMVRESFVEVAVGLETPLTVTSTVSPPAMVPQLPPMLTVTVAPPLLVTGL